jgi:hypothetical protein
VPPWIAFHTFSRFSSPATAHLKPKLKENSDN